MTLPKMINPVEKMYQVLLSLNCIFQKGCQCSVHLAILLLSILFGASAVTHAASEKIPRRFLLVSFSMPKDSLAEYCQAAKKYHVTLVLRGLVNNQLKDTALAMNENDLQHCDWHVEPRLFSKFNVTMVPTLLEFDAPLKPGWSDSSTEPPVKSVSGHVTLTSMIEHLEKGGAS